MDSRLDGLLTTEQARRRLKLTTRRSVAAMLRAGRLRGRKVGRMWLVDEAQVAAYVVSRRHQQNGQAQKRQKRAYPLGVLPRPGLPLSKARARLAHVAATCA
jgi:excisionase family DNA binding protein